MRSCNQGIFGIFAWRNHLISSWNSVMILCDVNAAFYTEMWQNLVSIKTSQRRDSEKDSQESKWLNVLQFSLNWHAVTSGQREINLELYLWSWSAMDFFLFLFFFLLYLSNSICRFFFPFEYLFPSDGLNVSLNV